MNPEDIQDLKQLIEFLKENQVAEFDLDRGDLKVRLKFDQPPAFGRPVRPDQPAGQRARRLQLRRRRQSLPLRHRTSR